MARDRSLAVSWERATASIGRRESVTGPSSGGAGSEDQAKVKSPSVEM